MEKTYSTVLAFLTVFVLGVGLSGLAQAQFNRKLPHWPILQERANARRYHDAVPVLAACCEIQKTVSLARLVDEARSAQGIGRKYRIICSTERDPREDAMPSGGEDSSCAYGEKVSEAHKCAEACLKGEGH